MSGTSASSTCFAAPASISPRTIGKCFLPSPIRWRLRSRNAQLYEEVWGDNVLLDAIINSSANGIMILDTSCHVLKINRSLGRMTGWSPEEAVDRPCREGPEAAHTKW